MQEAGGGGALIVRPKLQTGVAAYRYEPVAAAVTRISMPVLLPRLRILSHSPNTWESEVQPVLQ